MQLRGNKYPLLMNIYTKFHQTHINITVSTLQSTHTHLQTISLNSNTYITLRGPSVDGGTPCPLRCGAGVGAGATVREKGVRSRRRIDTTTIISTKKTHSTLLYWVCKLCLCVQAKCKRTCVLAWRMCCVFL